MHCPPFHGMVLEQGLGHLKSIDIYDNGLRLKIGLCLESLVVHSLTFTSFPMKNFEVQIFIMSKHSIHDSFYMITMSSWFLNDFNDGFDFIILK